MTLVSGFEKIVRQQVPLAERNWLGLGGPAEFYAEPNTMDELAALVRRCRADADGAPSDATPRWYGCERNRTRDGQR